jgi:hypothetical protein
MDSYAVYLHERIHSRRPLSGRKRDKVMRFVRELADDPFRRGDYQDKDSAGHELQVKIVGGEAITYWADHAVKEIKIINIQPADRPQPND